MIPTNTKLLYVFEIKVDDYEELYGYTQTVEANTVLELDGENEFYVLEDVDANELAEALEQPDVSLSSLASGSPSVTKTGTLTFSHSDYSLRNQTGYSTTGYGAGGSITISVTVKNNSGIDQYFGYHSATTQGNIDKLKNNAVISYAQSGKDRLIRQGETKTFTFTIQNVNRDNALSMKNFESLLVFSPNFDDSATESATYNLAKIFAGEAPSVI